MAIDWVWKGVILWSVGIRDGITCLVFDECLRRKYSFLWLAYGYAKVMV